MEKFFRKIVDHSKLVISLFVIIAIICGVCRSAVSVDYDMTDYLPSDSSSTVAMNVMEDEFDGGIPGARVLIKNVSVAEALDYKKQIEKVDGVTEVTWLDDVEAIETPVEYMNQENVDNYYKDQNALFSVTIEEEKNISAVKDIRKIIGKDNCVDGTAVNDADSATGTVDEIAQIALVATLFVLFVLILTTTSWMEPFVILIGIGLAIIINEGSNLIFGEISFVSNAAGSVLQMAVSLDYSVFLLHRYLDCKKENSNVKEAMVEALCGSVSSILSSGLTTVIGFLALCMMSFRIGPDLGLVLAKGIAISLITTFVFMPCLVLVTSKWIEKTSHPSFMPSFHKFGSFIRQVTIPCVCVFVLAIAPAYLASNKNSFYYGSSQMFGEGTRLGDDTREIQDIYGKKDTYVLLVPKGDIEKQQKLSDDLHDIPQVSSILSYVDTVGSTIPAQYVEDKTEQLNSKHYTRYVLTVDVDYEGDEAFNLVKTVRKTADKYYPDKWLLAGQGVSTLDLKDTITADNIKVNLLAIGAVAIVLLIVMKSVVIPVILVLSIETAIWINMAVPYFANTTIFYIAYLIISSIQLGATVDYAILYTDTYREKRKSLPRKTALVETISTTSVSILTSGCVMVVVGFLMGKISTSGLLSQLGYFLGRGTIFSLCIVFLVLPGLLYLCDRWLFKKNDIKYIEMKEGGENHE